VVKLAVILALFATAALSQAPSATGEGAAKAVRKKAPQSFVLPETAAPQPVFEPPPPPVIAPGPLGVTQRQSETLLGRSPDIGDAPPSAGAVIRAIIGLVGLMVLAYLGGHPRVQQLERRLNIAHLTTAGLPFVLLGFLAAHPAVGILTAS
jgi:hypothetical protein